MASCKSFLVSLLAVAALLQCAVAATTHIVGGQNVGWTIPSGGAQVYSDWAASQTFAVGDSLRFDFNGGHDVARVSKGDFDSCSGSNPLDSLITTGPATVTLTSPGEHYYICTFSGHCSAGQKLAVNVVASSSTAPPSDAGSPTGSASPPMSAAPGSASSVAAGFILAVVLSVFSVLF